MTEYAASVLENAKHRDGDPEEALERLHELAAEADLNPDELRSRYECSPEAYRRTKPKTSDDDDDSALTEDLA
ncbi:hypothetical protein [Halobellus rubicundus]|uniref:Uncharacterized protein n=1 Tax=Halobellus rubicundus TaxID=2996466 RepID=A0ABD5MER0_9EURY